MKIEVKDNDLKWLGGLFDADGCFGISKNIRKSSYVYQPAAVVTTKYDVLVNYLHKLLTSLEVGHHIKNNSGCFNITISRLSEICKLYDILYGYVIGKTAEFKLLNNFCRARLRHENKKSSYTGEENIIYESLKELNKSHYGECLQYGICYETVDKKFIERISIEWLAGYIDGDGEINIHKIQRPNRNYQLRSTISITTGSPLCKNLIGSILDRYNIDYYLYKKSAGAKHKPNCRYKKFSFSIRKLDMCFRLCALLENKLVLKEPNRKILLKFLRSRLKNNLSKYSAEEFNYYKSIKKLLNDYKQSNYC